jgi:iron complex transport system ATP-binding protein
MSTALELRRVAVPERLGEVSLEVPAGRLVAVVGPNGSGKSTLLQVAAGLLPNSGETLWQGRPLARIPHLERGRLTAWVPQEAHFEFGFSVRSVVAQGRFAHGDDDVGVEAALERFDLLGLADRPVNQLSGGERHRVLLARALATEAPLQIWDEPLAALDVRHALDTLNLAHELTRLGRTVLFSLHDLRLAHCVDLAIVLHRGRLHGLGGPEAVLTPAALLEVFGVRAHVAPGLVIELP